MKRLLHSPLACSLLLLPPLACVRAHAQIPSPPPPPPSESAPTPANPQLDIQRDAAPATRIPRQTQSTLSALQGMVTDDSGRPLPAIEIRLEGPHESSRAVTSGDGIFRLLRVPSGTYDLILTRKDGVALRQPGVKLNPGEVLSIEVRLPAGPDLAVSPLSQKPEEILEEGSYKELSRRPDAEGAVVVPFAQPIAPEALNFQPQRDRWGIPFPEYNRYPHGEVPYLIGHWYDPFNRNILKADRPIGGKYFFSFTGDSITVAEGRRLPVPAGQSTATPGSVPFFGRGGQFFLSQSFITTFDLFHGDTSAFRPVDFRLRFTPVVNLNYLDARENQAVSPDVRVGTTRFDTKIGLQQGFFEVKLHDFGHDYDFVNLRVGIQDFVSDFRGFIFAEENLGARIFGNLRSNRFQYNLAGFDLLEKDTNSGINTFARRGREVAIANVYIQDAFFKGYTAQFSYHFVRDNSSSFYYDKNGFLVRPSPIGSVVPSRKDAHYFGWTGDGHIGRTNITHAFYEVRGNDARNEISNQKNEIDAQFGAVELSQDRDYRRFRVSALFASGDNNPRDRVARGFSSIVDGVNFAGGEFSFFEREGIPFTRAGVTLKAGDSFLPDMRGDKNQGQSNFVNPGVFVYNAGADADLTQKLKLVGNINFIQFARTQVLDFLLQQHAVPRTVGFDVGTGVIYRPFLTDNIVLHAGATALIPSSGLRQIYTSQTLYSTFILLKFQF